MSSPTIGGPVVHYTALLHNPTLFKTVSENSLFSVFRKGTRNHCDLTAEQLEKLLKAGANINEKEETSKMNFLQRCIVEEFSLNDKEGVEFRKVVQLLFSHGIDINNQDAEGDTALHLAVYEDEYKLVRLLLEMGANRAIVNLNGDTAYDYIKNTTTYQDFYDKERKETLNLLKLQ